MQILVVNAGSSSLKLSVVDAAGRTVLARSHPALSGDDLVAAARGVLEAAPGVTASGHRVVHGGDRFQRPTIIDEAAEADLRALEDLAPLHNPPATQAIHVLHELRPDLPAVACFDTAFHATLPAAASTYALPTAWSERWPLRRFGFHGLSHAWIARRVPDLLDRPAAGLRLVSCHLGAGASLAAVEGGRSIDTTMGFTPLDGLVMATRSGSIDPGMLLWVQRHGRISPEDAESALDRDAGLLGLSGRSSDMREVVAGADAGDARCRLAFDVYLHRLRAGVAAMAAAMGGLDAIAFTGGVGEGSGRVRAAAAEGLGFVGVAVDAELNRAADGSRDMLITQPGSAVVAAVVHAREDLEIARQVTELLAAR